MEERASMGVQGGDSTEACASANSYVRRKLKEGGSKGPNVIRGECKEEREIGFALGAPRSLFIPRLSPIFLPLPPSPPPNLPTSTAIQRNLGLTCFVSALEGRARASLGMSPTECYMHGLPDGIGVLYRLVSQHPET